MRAESLAQHLVHGMGLLALVGGLVALQGSAIGTEPWAALAGVVGELSVTLPAALLILGATTLNLTAGAVLIRLVSGAPYSGYGQAILAGLAGAVVLDLVLMAALAGFGLFSRPLLLAAQLCVLALATRVRPMIAPGTRSLPRLGGWPLAWALVLIVWSGPVIVQLASPVVPFFDVLGNHVAPVEHLRTFGALSSLDLTPAPNFGPSRTLLGYQALLGVQAALTGVPAVTAVAAFALPLTALVATAGWRLAVAIAGPLAGLWALLLLPLALTFLLLASARAAVVAFPLVALALVLLIEPLGVSRGRQATVLTLALAAAILVHPLQGLIATGTVAIAVAVRPAVHAGGGLAAVGLTAVATAPLVALPQWLTMAGYSLPTWAALAAVPFAAAPVLLMRGGKLCSAGSIRLARWANLLPAIVAGVAAAAAAVVTVGAGWSIGGVIAGAASSAVLLAVAIHSIPMAWRSHGYPLLWLAAGAALLAAVLAGAVVVIAPGADLAEAIAYEVPKTANYFAWPMLAIAAAVGLAVLWRRADWPLVLRAGVSAVFIVAATAPIRPAVVNPLALGEHALAEGLSISLRTAAHGYWQGYPDPRTILDADQRELLGALRAEIDAGRLRADSRVLHVASSFQTWSSTPLAVFTGVTETTASLDPEYSIHTSGGRLHDVSELPALLGMHFPYVILEPAGLPPHLGEQITTAGYSRVFANARGEIFALGSGS